MKVILYSKPACGYCVMAKNLLNSKGIDYEERYLDNPTAIKDFIVQNPTKRTMPQIWIDDEHIGGFKELKIKLS
tara:strand:- start:182 stop:403 length:222 start_codon:yes stop_codon:yes gene_type:complete